MNLNSWLVSSNTARGHESSSSRVRHAWSILFSLSEQLDAIHGTDLIMLVASKFVLNGLYFTIEDVKDTGHRIPINALCSL